MLLHVGDIVKMRKQHPCGNDLWRITFVGSDIKMRCEKCERLCMKRRRPAPDRPFRETMTGNAREPVLPQPC